MWIQETTNVWFFSPKTGQHFVNRLKIQMKYQALFSVKESYFLRWMNTQGDFAAIFHKGNNFCDFLIAFLHISRPLKRGLLYKEWICSLWEQIHSI